MYNQSHSQIGQVRMAGSLETSNRRVNRNNLIEIERESTSLYDELFPDSRARTPGTRAPRKEEPKKNKNPISPITKKILDDDSYKSDPELNQSDSDIEPSPRRRKSKSEKNIVVSPRNRQRFIDSESDDQDKNYLDDDDEDDDIDVIRKPVKFVTPTPRKIPPTVRRPPVVHSPDRRFRNDDDDDEDDDNNKETFTKVDARPNQKRAPVTVNQYRSESNLSSNNNNNNNNNNNTPARNLESEVRPRTVPPTANLQDLIPPNDYSHSFFDGMDDLEFLYRLAPRGTLICCTIRIRPNVIASDEYELSFKDCPGKSYPLVTTSAKAVATGVFYWLKARYSQKNGGDKSKNIEIGKLESNFGKKKFTLTTPTLSNFTKEYDYDYNEKYNVHEHFGLVYGNRLIADAKPKEIKITLKTPKTNANEHLGTDSNEIETHILESKRPVLNQTTRNYQLDFRGRANLPSTSNVQIIEPTNPEEILLQLGRMEKHEYSLDFSYPFCILSAFGFALACLSRG